MPLVSVLVPTYNHAEYIEECLLSLVNQKTEFEYEILVGEDDSGDGTREICKSIAERFPEKIRLFLNDRKNVIYINGKPTGRWNLMNLIQHAEGKYIAICEGDDKYLDEHKLQKQVDFMERHPDFTMSFHPVLWWETLRNRAEVYAPVEKRKVYTLDDFLRGNLLIGMSSVMYKAEAIKKLPAWFRELPTGDIGLHALAASKGRIGFLDEVMSLYRFHGSGLASGSKEEEKARYTIQGFEILGKHLKVSNRASFREGMERLNGWLKAAKNSGENPELQNLPDKKDVYHETEVALIKNAMNEFSRLNYKEACLYAGIFREKAMQQTDSGTIQSPKNGIKISVIVPIKEEKFLKPLLSQFQHQTLDKNLYEVVLVYPESISGISPEEDSLNLKKLVIPEAFTTTEMLNAGSRVAIGEVLVFLAESIQLPPQYLKTVKEIFDEEDFFCVNGPVFNTRLNSEQGNFQPLKNKQNNGIPINICIRKKLFSILQGFDPLLYHHAFHEIGYLISRMTSSQNIPFEEKLATYINHSEWKLLANQSSIEKEMNYLQFKNRLLYKWIVNQKRKDRPRVSIIIVTYNSEKTLLNNLNSTINTIRDGDEIIIVDNHSKDKTKSILKEYSRKFPFIRLVLNKENKGFTAATNQGIKLSKNPFIIFLNPDTVVTQGWIEKMLDKFSSPEIGAVGPVSNYAAGLQNVSNYVQLQQKVGLEQLSDFLENQYSGKYIETPLLIGFCMMIRKEVFERLGPLDGQLFLGNDDLELSWRMRLNGYKLLVAPDTFIFHDGHHSFRQDKTSKSEQLVQESTNVLYHKLERYYGPGNVPPPNEIWGITWFKPENATFNPAIKWNQVITIPGNPEKEPEYLPQSVDRDLKNQSVSTEEKLTSIIMLTYNQLEYTQACIESIYEHTDVPFELIIVDNHSTDGTRKWLKQLQKTKKNVKLILNQKNEGFPKGCNQGIKMAKGEYILLLNNDVIVTDGWLSRMVNAFERDPELGIVGPMTNNISGPQKDPQATYSSIEEMHAYAAKVAEMNHDQLMYFPRIVGFAMLIKREVIEKIGMLEESFGSGNYEDDDFCLRAELAGFKAAIVKDSFIHHFGSVSFTAEGLKQYVEKLSQNSDKFYEKWKDLDKPSLMWSIFLFNKAKEEKEKGNIGFALELYEKVFQQKPEEKVLIEEYTGLLLETGQTETAMDKLEQYLEKQPEDHEGWNFLGSLYLDAGRIEDAYHAFQKAVKLYNQNLDYFRNLVDVALLLDDFETATTGLEYILTRKPGDKEASLKMAHLMMEAGEANKAKEFLSFALEQNPSDEQLQFYLKKTASPMLYLTYAFIEGQRFDLAIEAVEQYLKENPDDVEALSLKASLLFYHQKFEEAEKIYARILDLAPAHPEARYYLMKLYRMGEKNNELKALLETFRDEHQEDASLLQELILSFIELEEFEQALKYIETYIGQFPEDYFGYWVMGNLYREMEETDKALRFYHSALEKGIDNPEILADIEEYINRLEAVS